MLGKTNSVGSYEKVNNQDLLIQENGIYQASGEYTGLGVVTVDVPTSSLFPKTYVFESEKEDFSNPEHNQYTEYKGPYTDETGKSFDGLDKIKVRKIGSWIDSEISMDNILKGHSILGVSGNVIPLNAEPEKIIDPSKSVQIVLPTEPYNSLSSVRINPVVVSKKTVNPERYTQHVLPEKDTVGLSSVTITPVTAAIDSNILAENIKKGISILDVEGTLEATSAPIIEETLSITPSITSQSYDAATIGADGYKIINVSAVTHDIDANIQPKNIKRGIEILGITGTYTVENLQDKTIAPSLERQYVTFDDTQYEALRSVTILPVTPSIDTDIRPENIKVGVNILGIEGTFEGAKVQDPITVIPKTEVQTINPDEGFDGISSVTVNKVTNSIDPNILAENIKKGIEILGVTGNLEAQKLNLQPVKNVNPSGVDVIVTPDENYDALLKVIVNAVTASVDSNIRSENIKKNISILGVMGELEGGKQSWFNFLDTPGYSTLSDSTLGGGSFSPSDKELAKTSYTLNMPLLAVDTLPITNISAVLFQSVFGYNDTKVTKKELTQTCIYFDAGGYYSTYSDYYPIPPMIKYIYPYINTNNIDGCLLNVENDGLEKTVGLYLIEGDTPEKHLFDLVLVQGEFSDELLPENFTSKRYIRDIIIPEYTPFEPKHKNPETDWVLKKRKGVAYAFDPETDTSPALLNTSAFDNNFGEEEQYNNTAFILQREPITKIGGVDIVDAIASNFSHDNYLQIPKAISSITNCDIITKFMLNDYISIIFGSTSYELYVNGSGCLEAYTSGWYYGTSTLQKNKLYWVRIIKNAEGTKVYSLEDNSYEIDTLPNISTWKYEMNLNTALFTNNVIRIGYSERMSNYFKGSIDLLNTQFTINNEMWYKPFEKVYRNITNHEIIPMRNELELAQRRTYTTNINYVHPFENIPSTLVDNNNFIVDNKLQAVVSGSASYHKANSLSFGYIHILPLPQNNSVELIGYTSSEQNFDFGGVYLGTQIFKPNREQIKNKTTDGNGKWIFSESGNNTEKTYNFTLEKNKDYYLCFAYAKEGGGDTYEDRLIIKSIKYNVIVTKGSIVNYPEDDGSQTVLKLYSMKDTIGSIDKKYTNFNKIGNINVNTSTGNATGFNTDSGIELPQKMPAAYTNMKALIYFNLDSIPTNNVLFCNNTPGSAENYVGVRGSGYLSIYSASEKWKQGKTKVVVHTPYWAMVTLENSMIKVYLLQDNGYTLDTIPPIGDWSLECEISETSLPIFTNTNLAIGYNHVSTGEFFHGTIELSKTRIYIDGIEWWNPLLEGTYDNFERYGNIQLSSSILSNFNSSNYIQLPKKFPSMFENMEIIIKANYHKDTGAHNCLFSKKESNAWFGIKSNSNHFATYQGSWTEGTTEVIKDKWYWMRVIKNNDTATFDYYLLADNNYTLETLPSIENWSFEFSCDNNYFSSSTFTIGYNELYKTSFFDGKVDLNGTNIMIDNKLFWSPKTLEKSYAPLFTVLSKTDIQSVEGYDKIIFMDNIDIPVHNPNWEYDTINNKWIKR